MSGGWRMDAEHRQVRPGAASRWPGACWAPLAAEGERSAPPETGMVQARVLGKVGLI